MVGLTKEQLAAEIQKIEEAEKLAQLNKRKEDAEQWVGKCFSSHLFTRKTLTKEIVVRKISGLDIRGEKIYYKAQQIVIRLAGERCCIERLEQGLYDEPFPTWISSWSYPVEESTFDKMYQLSYDLVLGGFSDLQALFKEGEGKLVELQDGIEADRSRAFAELGRRLGWKFLDISSRGNLVYLLEEAGYPLVGGGKIPLTGESLLLLEAVLAVKNEALARGHFFSDSYREYCRKGVDLLTALVKEVKTCV